VIADEWYVYGGLVAQTFLVVFFFFTLDSPLKKNNNTTLKHVTNVSSLLVIASLF